VRMGGSATLWQYYDNRNVAVHGCDDERRLLLDKLDRSVVGLHVLRHYVAQNTQGMLAYM